MLMTSFNLSKQMELCFCICTRGIRAARSQLLRVYHQPAQEAETCTHQASSSKGSGCPQTQAGSHGECKVKGEMLHKRQKKLDEVGIMKFTDMKNA